MTFVFGNGYISNFSPDRKQEYAFEERRNYKGGRGDLGFKEHLEANPFQTKGKCENEHDQHICNEPPLLTPISRNLTGVPRY